MLKAPVKTGCIEDGTKIWWDIRPSVRYPTIEFRVCDACTRIEETLCIAAITQAVVAKLYKLRSCGMSLKLYTRELLYENKWRAMRYGLDGELIDFADGRAIPTREAVHRLLDFIDDVVDGLGSRKEVEYAYTIMHEGTSADRQIKRYRERSDPKAVVDLLIEETMLGCGLHAASGNTAPTP